MQTLSLSEAFLLAKRFPFETQPSGKHDEHGRHLMM